MAIQNLPAVTTLSLADQVAIASSALGDDARAALSTLVTFIQSQLTATGGYVTQYASPNASGFSVSVNPATTGGNVFLLLTPLAGYAAGTVVLPPNPVDAQEVLSTCTQSVTTLTVNGNGKTVNGAPGTLAAHAFFRLRFDGVNQSWYRVG